MPEKSWSPCGTRTSPAFARPGAPRATAAPSNSIPPDHAVLKGTGKAPGSAVDGAAQMKLSDGPDGGTLMDWTADVHIHGKLASVGARLIEGTAKKMIAQTFDCIRLKLEA